MIENAISSKHPWDVMDDRHSLSKPGGLRVELPSLSLIEPYPNMTDNKWLIYISLKRHLV